MNTMFIIRNLILFFHNLGNNEIKQDDRLTHSKSQIMAHGIQNYENDFL